MIENIQYCFLKLQYQKLKICDHDPTYRFELLSCHNFYAGLTLHFQIPFAWKHFLGNEDVNCDYALMRLEVHK